jgi:hypothetical protein
MNGPRLLVGLELKPAPGFQHRFYLWPSPWPCVVEVYWDGITADATVWWSSTQGPGYEGTTTVPVPPSGVLDVAMQADWDQADAGQVAFELLINAAPLATFVGDFDGSPFDQRGGIWYGYELAGMEPAGGRVEPLSADAAVWEAEPADWESAGPFPFGGWLSGIGSWSSYYWTAEINLCSPIGTQPVAVADGRVQVVSRRMLTNEVSGARALTLWTRPGAGDWTHQDASYAPRWPCPLHEEHGLLVADGEALAAVEQTLPGPRIFSPPVLWRIYPTGLTHEWPAAVAIDPVTRWGLSVYYGWAGGTDDLVVRLADGTEHNVAANVRGGLLGNRPWPWCWVDACGVWYVGASVAGELREWYSGNAGRTWTPGTVQVVGSDAEAVHAAFAQGRALEQVLVTSRQDEDGTTDVRVWWRADWTAAWAGPEVLASTDRAAAPIVQQDQDGAWEVGWLLGGAWTRYRALNPAGPWTVV